MASESSSSQSGQIFVISGPSGVGKGTLCRLLLADVPDLVLSISATSRPRREGEQDGVDYDFKSPEAFQRMIEGDALLEWAEYNQNYYGTPREAVLEQLGRGKSVLLEIDVQGALMVKEKYPEACLIFIAPPGMEELERRLRGRGTDDEENIRRRLEISRQEMALQGRFDYVVINDALPLAEQALKNILVEACSVTG